MVTRVDVAAPAFGDMARQARVRGGSVPPGVPALLMPAGKTALVLSLPQRQVEAGQDGRPFRVEGEVIAVEQQAAGAQDGGEFGVRGAQVRFGQPVQRGGAHRGVGRAAQVQLPGPAGNAQVQVDQAEPGKVLVGGQAQGQRDRVGIDADDRGPRQPAEQADGQ